MSWTSATSDLRVLLSDGPSDRICYRKKCFGEVNDTNAVFKTFEQRRTTDFTSATAPDGVYVSGTLATVSSDDTLVGEFVLADAPSAGQVVTATYYFQWFLDSELQQCLVAACEWLGLGEEYQNIPQGLRPAAKYYAGQEAYHKLTLKWAARVSEVYLLEDSPDPEILKIADTYRAMANDFKKKSVELRDQYYTRQGQSLSPLFGTSFGAVPSPVPRE